MQFTVHSHLLKMIFGAATLVFNLPVLSITLQEAFESALKVDPVIRASKFNQEASNENIAIARSRLLPQISLQGASNQLTQTTTQDVPGSASISRSFTGPSMNNQILMRQGLIRPKELSALNFAKLQSEYSVIKHESDISELWYRVSNAYIDLLGAQQIADVNEKPIIHAMLAFQQEKTRYEKGDGTKDAVIESEAQYLQAKSVYIQSQHNLWAKQRSFLVLTQIDPFFLNNFKLSLHPNLVVLEGSRDETLIRFKEGSYELKLGRYQENMQRERLRINQADHLPTLDVIAAWNTARNDAISTQGYKYKNNQIGIQYTFPIFAGGGIASAARQAGLSLEATLADNASLTNKIENDFVTYWSAAQGYAVRVEAGNALISSAVTQQKAIQLSVVHGVKTRVDLASSELSLARRIVDQINLISELNKLLIKISRKNHIIKLEPK
jgi:protease secretion system outer membrane protein